MLTIELDPKRLELLHELVPAARVVGALVNAQRSDASTQSNAVTQAAERLGLSAAILSIADQRHLRSSDCRENQTPL